MGYLERISRAFEKAPCLPLTPSSRIVLMSDCHRGTGNANDNYLKNETLFLSALRTYYKNGYTYIELGDGDELWENRRIEQIQRIHDNTFCLLDKFYNSKRLYLLYGNHDQVKKNKCCGPYQYYEGLILRDCLTGRNIYLTHGHQADLLNSTLWKLARFLVRYIWKPLELYGVTDPTSAADNYKIKEKSEQRLNHWALKNHGILVTGHTHRAMTGSSENPYFNSGCCIYPGSITALEITNRKFLLVKWTLGVRDDHTLYVTREVLSNEISISEIFI
ncbi:MAG: serine/threonine protein phosphatase [Lachnospiraceae bacterium]|nr:serine/threonine protein phosphatase [Lachnospiraceae bacterium]